VTEEILEMSLAERGHVVERRRELIGFSQTADCVNSMVRHGDGVEEPIRSQFLVSCEGAHSVIRKQAGLTFTGATFPLRFLLADVTIDWDLPDNEVQAWFHRDGSFAALPFGAQKWRLIAECADDQDDAPREVTLELLQDLVVERTGKKNVRIRDPFWLSDFRINARMVDRFRDKRVFVAGDAAHIHSPAGGQGIATGIQDATNLAWKLAAFLREGAGFAPRYLRRGTPADCARSASAHERGLEHYFRDESGRARCSRATALSDPAHAVRATALVREALAASDELSPPKSLGAFRCTVLAGLRSCR
jgi:2-polyprenyl-6-methoxyphenol hydroxylase-like FAD-dependent oxidoreductase